MKAQEFKPCIEYPGSVRASIIPQEICKSFAPESIIIEYKIPIILKISQFGDENTKSKDTGCK